MELRADYRHPLSAGSAVGFVLGELPGGRVTGWIEDGLELTGGPPKQLRINNEAEIKGVLKAVLPDSQVDAIWALIQRYIP